MDAANYFDHAATTPIDPEVLEAMLPYLKDEFGNASSLHSWGLRARHAVEIARGHVASLLGCDPQEVFFTSGATEANNWVLQSYHDVAVSPFEHSSIWETARTLGFPSIENEGYKLFEGPQPQELLSVMLVNNETGAILDPPSGGYEHLHRDVTQALGKVAFNLNTAGKRMNFASMSAHKLYGPKGVGALYVRDAEPLEPLLYGGEQEQGLRAGTLNVAGIVGFGAAAKAALDRQEGDHSQATRLRNVVINELQGLSDWKANQHDEQSPFILSLSFLGIEGETLVVEADTAGFAVSSGAACSSRSTEPSHVLTALGIEPEWLGGTIRVSFGRGNTDQSAMLLAKMLKNRVETLRGPDKRPDLGNKL